MVLTIISIILWSGFKYVLGAGIAMYSNIGFIPSFTLTVGGGMLGILLFTFFGNYLRKKLQPYFPKKKKITINRRTRMLVKFKKYFGLPGIALLTPVLLSIPVGVLLATGISRDKKKIFLLMTASLIFWSLVFFVPYYTLGIDIQSLIKSAL